MTGNKILKPRRRASSLRGRSLTPARIKKELAEIQAVELPLDLQKWVGEW